MLSGGRGIRKRATASIAAVALVAAAGCSSASDDEAGPTGPESSAESSDSPPATDIEPTGGTAETTTVPQEPEEPFEPRQISVVMNGDMLLHEGLWETARIDAARTGRGALDFRPLLSDMRPVIAGADLSICHMETPLAPPGGPFLGYPVFAAPPSIVPALKWAGYDACTTASNHSIDQGFDGLTRTLDDFAAAGIETAGTAATKQASRTPLVMDVDGVSVGLISATYGTNGIPLPEDEPWSVPLIKTLELRKLATKATEMGADIVLVALHWGLEYTHPPTQDQIDVAEVLTRSPNIDLVYGHHAHVVQPYDKVNGTWVVYGLGNAVAQQDTAVEGVYDGNTARVEFTERRSGDFAVTSLEYIPTMITPFDGVDPMRWLNVPQDLRDPAYASLKPALQATQQRVSDVVGMLGAFSKGVVEGR